MIIHDLKGPNNAPEVGCDLGGGNISRLQKARLKWCKRYQKP